MMRGGRGSVRGRGGRDRSGVGRGGGARPPSAALSDDTEEGEVLSLPGEQQEPAAAQPYSSYASLATSTASTATASASGTLPSRGGPGERGGGGGRSSAFRGRFRGRGRTGFGGGGRSYLRDSGPAPSFERGGGRYHGRGRGRGRFDNANYHPSNKRFREDGDRGIPSHAEIPTKRYRENAASFGSKGEISAANEQPPTRPYSQLANRASPINDTNRPATTTTTTAGGSDRYCGMDRPLAEANTRNSWDDRSQSQDGSASYRPPASQHSSQASVGEESFPRRGSMRSDGPRTQSKLQDAGGIASNDADQIFRRNHESSQSSRGGDEQYHHDGRSQSTNRGSNQQTRVSAKSGLPSTVDIQPSPPPPTVEKSTLPQTGYAALANLPGPIRAPPKTSSLSSASRAVPPPSEVSTYSSIASIDAKFPTRPSPDESYSNKNPNALSASRPQPWEKRSHSPTFQGGDFGRRFSDFGSGPRAQNWGSGPGRGGRTGRSSFHRGGRGGFYGGRGGGGGRGPNYFDGGMTRDGSGGGPMPQRDMPGPPAGGRGPPRPVDTFVGDDAGVPPQDGQRTSTFDFHGGRGRAAFGMYGGRGRHRDMGRGRGRGWDQMGSSRPWDNRSDPYPPVPGNANLAAVAPTPASATPLTSTFAMLADANPHDLFRRRPSVESSGGKLPQQGINPQPGETSVQDRPSEVNEPTENMTPSLPPRPATPPPSEPSGLVVALTRLADMEEELNFAYSKHMKLIAKQTSMRKAYEILQDLPVGLEAFEDEYNSFMENRAAATADGD